MQTKPPKPKPCKVCREVFQPRPMQSVCGPDCAREFARDKRERDDRKKQREEGRQTRARLEELKTLPQLLKEAQREFNRFIRLRDAGRDCICCPGIGLEDSAVGGGFDAGHYRSVGSAPSLRFYEDNVHGQRKRCNRWGAGRAVDYRSGLIDRIGLGAVEALEANNTPHKWTRQEVREIRDTYQAKANALEKASK